MSTMEVEHNNVTNPSEGSPVIGGNEGEQKGLVLDELLQDEFKGDDSVDCFIKRARDPGEDGSEFNLNYEESSIVSSSAFYSPKEESTDNNSSSLEKAFAITLNNTEVRHGSSEDKANNEGQRKENTTVVTTEEIEQNTSVTTTEETEEDTSITATEETEEDASATTTEQTKEDESVTTTEETKEFTTTEEKTKEDESVKTTEETKENESVTTAEETKENESVTTTEREETKEDESAMTEETKEDESVTTTEESKEDASIIAMSVEKTNEIVEENEEEGDSDSLDKVNSDSLQRHETESSMTSEERDSEVGEINKEHYVVQNSLQEMVDEVQDSTAVIVSTEMLSGNEMHDSTVPSEILSTDSIYVPTAPEAPSEIQNNVSTALESPSEIINSDEMLVDSSEVQLSSETVTTDEMDVLTTMQPSSEAMDIDEKQDSSGKVVTSPMLSCNTEENERDGNNDENAKVNGTGEARKDMLYLVFQPKEQVSKSNDGGNIVQSNEECASNGGTTVNTTSIDMPVKAITTKTLITIGGNPTLKTGKELSKSIIVKKVTAKVIKSGNTTITRQAREVVQDQTNVPENESAAKISEAEEKSHTKSHDPVEFDELEKEINDDDINESPRKKLRLFRKTDPTVLKDQKLNNFEDKEAPDADTHDRHSNVNEGEQDPVLENGSPAEVNTKTQISNKENHVSSEKKATSKTRKSNENTGKKTTSFEVVKRKFEEIYTESREEEDAAIKEIKKMKKETLDVLKKINAEMEKLKKAFMAGN